MDQRKARSKLGNVPFSWENKPGVAKNFHGPNPPPIDQGHLVMIKLPPPPCPTKVACNRTPAHHDIQIPLPPCTFQPPPPPPPPLRSSSGKGTYDKNRDDPFFAAYKECTKSSSAMKGGNTKNKLSGLRKGLFSFSCKHSFGVLDGNLVRVSQLPCEN